MKRVIDCGDYLSNWWVKTALDFLPDDLPIDIENEMVFVSTRNNVAFRLARHYVKKQREIIVLSGPIFPNDGITEPEHPDARYFIFCVLHEIAHALKNHKRPNKIEKLEKDQQEEEANDLACTWFNEHLEKENECLKKISDSSLFEPITKGEIEIALGKIIVLKRIMRNRTKKSSGLKW